MGRQGILQSMVLYDINKDEAKELARKNLLEYRSDDLVALGKRLATTNDSEDQSEKRARSDQFVGKNAVRTVSDIEEMKKIFGRK